MDDKNNSVPDNAPTAADNLSTQEPAPEYRPPEQETPLPTTPLPTAPVLAPAPVVVTGDKRNTPLTLVLQWLTYAFWGWFILALSLLTYLSMGYIVNSAGSGIDGTFTAYSLAAVIVLFVIALACDIIYSRSEPEKKTGPATIIMVIHAVIFALCGIGALISAVFAIVNMLIDNSSTSDIDGPVVTLISSLLIFVVYGIVLIRTLHPVKIPHVTQMFWVVIGIITAAVIAVSVFGPVAHARLTRDDRLIEESLPSLSQDINNYAAQNGSLPKSLEAVKESADTNVKDFIDKKLVTYTPNIKPAKKPATTTSFDMMNGTSSSAAASRAISYYRLCVSYKAEKTDSYGYDDITSVEEGETSPNTYSHAKGKVCYNLQTDYDY